MRSLIGTILVLVAALAGGAMAFVHFTQRDLSLLFGTPALAPDSLLFDYDPADVTGLTIDSKGRPRHYHKGEQGWTIETTPQPDRADYRAMQALIAFGKSLKVVTHLDASKVNLEKTGLKTPTSRVRINGKLGNPLVDFAVGKSAPWHRYIPPADETQQGTNIRAFYILPDNSRHIYLCTSDFWPEVQKNGWGSLRDKRPFFFAPEILAGIEIQRQGNSLVLERTTPLSAWRITKPLQTDVDNETVAKLVGGLYNLTAETITYKPAPPNPHPELSISLNYFLLDGTVHEQATTLLIDAPAGKDAQTVGARLANDRQDILFDLPLNKATSGPALNSLPLTLGELRGNSLTTLDLRQLAAVTLNAPSFEGPLRITIEKSPITGEWRAMKSYQGTTAPANERTYFELKKTLAEEKALGVASDSASNLAEFGLDQPAGVLTLELFDGQKESLELGIQEGNDGLAHYYCRHSNSRIVLEISSDVFFTLLSQPHQWRDAVVWNFTPFDLNLLKIERRGQPALLLKYNDLNQTWEASRNGETVTSLLNENRANRYLETLQGLTAERWLGESHPSAAAALADPVFMVAATFRPPDDPSAPLTHKVLRIAGNRPSGTSQFYFAKIDGDLDYFILDLPQVQKLAVELLEE